MILGIDIGNTRTKLALVSDGEARAVRSIRTALLLGGSSLEFPPEILEKATAIDGVVISCVVPALSSPVRETTAKIFESPVLVVDHKTKLPFKLGLKKPAEVGADRLCLAAGAVAMGKENAIVADVGSAVTVDLVQGGVFMGGVIGSGPDLVLSALGGYTAKLPSISFVEAEKPFDSPCDDTVSSMIAGASLGTLGLIKEATGYLRIRARYELSCIITGGSAPEFLPFLPKYWIHDRGLIFRGMNLIWLLSL
jgi:type III pantothenate kinase